MIPSENSQKRIEIDNRKILGRGRIKKYSLVAQDHSVYHWVENESLVFDVCEFTDKKYMLVREGFGDINSYGNGAVYVDKENVEFCKEEKIEKREEGNKGEFVFETTILCS